jgi:ribitol-5-phosphate 2-dehydrogenase (NADP+) / D-ribitol-5-phosphate cytidylyltransferase
MYRGYRIGALLLMGGRGERFGSAIPKQFHPLAGKPIYIHALEAFLCHGAFDEIVLSCSAQWLSQVSASLPHGPIRLVEGGKTRQESSQHGLLGFSMPPDYVIIHDAVRPFVSQDIITHHLDRVLEMGAVNTCISSTDTLVYAPDSTHVESIPKRSDYLRGQTPQSFSYSLIVRAHQMSRRSNSSDDCILVHDLGHPIAIVPGEERNCKITSELDLILAEQLIRFCIHSAPPRKEGSLKNKVFCVVGGLGGIGSVLVTALRQAEADVLPLSRTSSPSLDVRKPETIRQIFNALPPLDGLINCSGVLFAQSTEALTIDQIEEMIDVNLQGSILCCKMAPLKQGAHVINIASSSFSRGRKNCSIYSSTKAGIVNFTQGFAEERPDLRVHAVVPKRVDTALRRNNFPEEQEEWLLHPQDVADTILSLLQTERASVIVDVRKSTNHRVETTHRKDLQKISGKKGQDP